MAAHGQSAQRNERLQALGLAYPIWVFDVDEASWPRKQAAILEGSRPARLTGWFRWGWEYGTKLYQVDEKIEAPGLVHTPDPRIKSVVPASKVLQQLRWDDRFPASTLSVVYEGQVSGKGTLTRGLENWIFEDGQDDFVSPQRIVRIKRSWDSMPLWGRGLGDGLLASPHRLEAHTLYGVASLVKSDEEFLAATGVKETNDGAEIRKAAFEFLDGDQEYVQGVVLPERYHADRGLYVTRGPDFASNKETLYGTALQDSPWEEVEAYADYRRTLPLM